MHKKVNRLIEANHRPYFLWMGIFVLIAIPIEPVLALAEAAILLCLYLYYRNQSRKRRRSMVQIGRAHV